MFTARGRCENAFFWDFADFFKNFNEIREENEYGIGNERNFRKEHVQKRGGRRSPAKMFWIGVLNRDFEWGFWMGILNEGFEILNGDFDLGIWTGTVNGDFE